MRYVYSPVHTDHDIRTQTVMGVQVAANEVRERALTIRAALDADGGFEEAGPSDHGIDPILAVHDPALLAFLETAWDDAVAFGHPYDFLAPETVPNRAATEGMSPRFGRPSNRPDGRAGFFAFDTSTYLLPGTYTAARAAVDVALTTADLVLGGERAAYGLCRPPGHHAARSMFGGFCYLNNAAIAAEALARRTGEHVSILDVDYHHGNGTEQIFWRREDVLYVSLHAHPDRQYPYVLGWEDEIGEGPGEGANLNIPLPAHTTDEQYLAALERGLERIADEPGDTVVVSLGFDTYGKDPIGDFALTTAGYHACGRRVAALGKRLVILQEGGYHVGDIGENARAWLRGAEGRPYQSDRVVPGA
jgi:acetoin utilization deacetylase AcuC-like enzyme